MENVVFNFFRQDGYWVYTVEFKDKKSEIIKTDLKELNSIMDMVTQFGKLPNIRTNLNFTEENA